MPTFDPISYLDQETTESSERRPPLPVGDYQGVTGEVKTEPWSNDQGQSGMRCLVPITLQIPPAVVEELNLRKDTMVFTDRIFLDLTANGAIDWSPGMNRRLRQYRIALDMNKAGEAFSLRKLGGRPIRVRLIHDLYKGEIQERLDAVSAP